jgi:hypothetical protein
MGGSLKVGKRLLVTANLEEFDTTASAAEELERAEYIHVSWTLARL